MMLEKDTSLPLAETTEIPDQSVREGETLTLDVALKQIASGVAVSYSLAPGAPEGVEIQAKTGIVSWETAEQDGGKTPPITVIYDLSLGGDSEQLQERFVVKVVEVDEPPRILAIPDYVLKFDSDGIVRLQLEAVDPDLPSNKVVYTLLEMKEDGEAIEKPVGFELDQKTGSLTWKPSKEKFAKVFTVRARVEEVSQAASSSEISFQIRLPAAAVQ